MKSTIVIGLVLVASALNVWAERVAPNSIVRAVDSWIAQKGQMECPIEGTVSSVRLCTATNGAAFYVAKLKKGGFVITSTDTEVDPIIAFSTAPDFVEDSRNPLWALLVRDLVARKSAVTSGSKVSGLKKSASVSGRTSVSPATMRWAQLLSPQMGLAASGASLDGSGGAVTVYGGMKSISDVRVSPFVKTKWGQGKDSSGAYCFNYYTPNHSVCGCTATAGAQILRYHKFPTVAVEPRSYKCKVNGKTVTLKQKGGIYAWNNMPYVPGRKTTTAQRQAIGRLTYDVGLAVDSSYTRNDTWGYLDKFVDLCLEWGYAHGKTFSYTDSEYWSDDDWSDDDWSDDDWYDDDWYDGGWYEDDWYGGFSEIALKTVMLPNLDARLPVGVRIYGESDDVAHFVVADGYGYSFEQLCVHLNMGWDGDCDAWYVLPGVIYAGYAYTGISHLYGNIYPKGAERGAIVSGRVLLSSTSKPIEGVVVTASDREGNSLSTRTDAKGVYALILPEEDWKITVENAAANTFPESYSQSIRDSRNHCELDFELTTHSVSFDANGGTCEMIGGTNYYATLGTLPTPTRTGYTFAGWFTSPTGGTRVTESTLVTEDVTYYAQWTANPYMVTFDANGGEGLMEPMTFVYDVAQPLKPNAFVNGDLAFRGWTFSRKRRMSFTDGELVTNLVENGSVTLYAVWGDGLLQVEAGEYVKWTLEELGFQVPTDGRAYTVSSLGLPSGLKLVKSPAVTKKVKDKKTGKTNTVVVIPAGVNWWIEGVATAACDFKTHPAYLTVAAAGTNYTAAVFAESLPQNVVDLGSLQLGVPVKETGWLPGVTNGWSVGGLPAGLEYSGTKPAVTKKLINAAKKLYSVTTNAPAYTVYGTPTKAGLCTVTAKKKVNGFDETRKFQVLVIPREVVDTTLFGTSLTNLETTAYEPFLWSVAGGSVNVAKVAGIPAGVVFNAKQQTLSGTPLKSGTYVVTFTKNVKSGKKIVAKTVQILWTVRSNPQTPDLLFNAKGGRIVESSTGVSYADLLAFDVAPGATVKASGLPKGVFLVKLADGRWGFKGVVSSATSAFITVAATINGNTQTQRLLVRFAALPTWVTGAYDGVVRSDGQSGAVRLTVTTAGKISGIYRELGTNWTFSASSFTDCDESTYICTNAVARYTYSIKSGKKVVKNTLVRHFEFKVKDTGYFGAIEGCEAFIYPGSTFEAIQNVWAGTYKALGKQLFYQSKTVPYRIYTYDALGGLGEGDKLTLKITSNGTVTATLTHPTGSKDRKTKREIVYKAVWTTALIPTSSPEDGAKGFNGTIILYFPASVPSSFGGLIGTMEFTP